MKKPYFLKKRFIKEFFKNLAKFIRKNHPRFLKKRNITSSLTKIIDISYEKTPELYCDYNLCLEFLRKIDYSKINYPGEITNFHIYTEVKNEKELMAIKSYLATQNLEKTRLFVWSDYDISNNPLIQPYKNHVTFNVYDAVKEAVGTPIQGDKRDLPSKTENIIYKAIWRAFCCFINMAEFGMIWM